MDLENGHAVPSIRAHTFEAAISDTPITFHVMQMNNCLFLWIGDKGCFENLSVAMTTPYSSLPTTTSLMGLTEDDHSSSLAARLSRKTGKQVFASCNLAGGDEGLMVGVTQRLMRELAECPDKF